MTAEPIYKFLLFIKRRPDMTPEQFEHYYENVHSKLGKNIVPDVGAFKYVRRYLFPLDGSLDRRASDLEYDEITEVWFRDYAKFKVVAEKVSRGFSLRRWLRTRKSSWIVRKPALRPWWSTNTVLNEFGQLPRHDAQMAHKGTR